MAIITTADTGCADVVGDAALLVPSGDPAALRQAILRLAQDATLRASLGRRARERLERHFAWSIVAARHVELYRSTLAANEAELVQATTP
jgi:glycosyltransferase involved in cell wall biosynthesis